MSHLNLTVGIATLNRPDFVIQTVKEVLAQETSCVFDVVVFDQTNQELLSSFHLNEIERLRRECGVLWLHGETIGLTAARNSILAHAHSDLVVFIDDDVLLPAGYLQSHVDVFVEYPDVVGVAGPVFHRQENAPVDSLMIEDRERGTKEHFGNRNPWALVIGWEDIMVGCNHAIRRQVVLDVGGYDEGIVGGYYEDSEISYRLRALSGGVIAFQPEAWLVHLRAPSGGCRINQNSAHTEADKLSGFHLFMIRHARGNQRLKLFRDSLRAGPLRRENLLSPWRWPAAWGGFFLSFWNAWMYRDVVKSSFNNRKKKVVD